jgi:hypothetical protein
MSDAPACACGRVKLDFVPGKTFTVANGCRLMWCEHGLPHVEAEIMASSAGEAYTERMPDEKEERVRAVLADAFATFALDLLASSGIEMTPERREKAKEVAAQTLARNAEWAEVLMRTVVAGGE